MQKGGVEGFLGPNSVCVQGLGLGCRRQAVFMFYHPLNGSRLMHVKAITSVHSRSKLDVPVQASRSAGSRAL